jgi:hypothetical protein
MRYWTGLVLFAAGAWLLYGALAHRRSVIALRQAAAARGADAALVPPNPSLEMFGDIFRPIILFALVYLGVKTTLAYYWLDAGRYLSLFDLAGFLGLLTGYGNWVVTKTRYRASPLALAGAVVDRATDTASAAAPNVPGPAASPRSGPVCIPDAAH